MTAVNSSFWLDETACNACNAMQTAIAGVVTIPLRTIPTLGGPVLHMIRNDHPLFSQFGEIYFSEVEPGCTKGWKRHFKQTQLFAVPAGTLRITLFDGREASPTYGQKEQVTLNRPEKYNLLRIPPLVWYSFTALGPVAALLANCVDIPHSAEEAEQRPLENPPF